MIASQLVETKEYYSAIKLLEPLCTQRLSPSGPPTPSPSIHSAVGRIYLLSGNLQKAMEHFRVVASCPDAGESAIAMNTALMCSAIGDWSRAESALREVLEHDPHNYTVGHLEIGCTLFRYDAYTIDDNDSDDNDSSNGSQQESKVDVSLTEEAQSTPAVDVNKPVPAPPPQSSPAPASSGSIYLPRLTAPSMFLPIPNVRIVFPLSSSP